MGLLHHTDAEREWAYDRTLHIGTLDKALDEANAKGLTVVDMKKDWKRVFRLSQVRWALTWWNLQNETGNYEILGRCCDL